MAAFGDCASRPVESFRPSEDDVKGLFYRDSPFATPPWPPPGDCAHDGSRRAPAEARTSPNSPRCWRRLSRWPAERRLVPVESAATVAARVEAWGRNGLVSPGGEARRKSATDRKYVSRSTVLPHALMPWNEIRRLNITAVDGCRRVRRAAQSGTPARAVQLGRPPRAPPHLRLDPELVAEDRGHSLQGVVRG